MAPFPHHKRRPKTLSSASFKEHNPTHEDSTLTTYSSLKGPPSNITLGLQFQHMNSEGSEHLAHMIQEKGRKLKEHSHISERPTYEIATRPEQLQQQLTLQMDGLHPLMTSNRKLATVEMGGGGTESSLGLIPPSALRTYNTYKQY